MNEKLTRLGSHLRPAATIAGYMLAIYGVIALGFPPVRWAYLKLSGGDVDGIARPICEFDPLPDTTFDDSGMRLTGVELSSFKRLENVRFEFRDLQIVVRWIVYSSGLSPAENKKIMDQLPRGRISAEVITMEIPAIPKSTTTTVQALAWPKADSTCYRGHGVNVTATNGRVYRSDPSFQTLWGVHFQPLTVLGAAAVLGIVVYVIRRRRSGPPSQANPA